MALVRTRREILALLGVSATTLAGTVSRARAESHASADVLDVAIVGAGAAGLTAGFLLDQAGSNFRVFEAAAGHGGRARKETGLADFPLDLGGEWIHTTNRVLNTLSGRKNAAARATEWRPVTSDVWDGQRLYSANQYAMEWRGEHRFTSTTWFDFFNDYMAEDIRDRIDLNTSVTEIDHTGQHVRLKFADGRMVQARHVIVTVPLNVLKYGDIRFTPNLPKSKRRALEGASMPDGFKLFIRFSERFYPDMVLFDHGYQTPEAETLFYNCALDKRSEQHILGWFGHGVVATPYTEMEEDALVQFALKLLDRLYDGAASPAYEAHVLQNWSKSPFHRGTYSFFHASTPAALGAPIEGRVHFAGEAYNQRPDGEWGYMHVAARSAYDAVAAIGRT